MTLFLKLLLAHLIGDFCFQPDHWIQDKEEKRIKSAKLYQHLAVHTLALIVLIGFDTEYWIGLAIILTSHWAIDVFKMYAQNERNKVLLFFVDQLLHIAVLAAVAYAYEPFNIDFTHLLAPQILLLSVLLIFITYVSAILIKVVISRWSPSTEDDESDSLAKAGRFIGMLERLFVFGFIVTSHWEVIGFLLAAKSVFRFGDLKESKDRKLTEYILIGTLLSFGVAIISGMLYNYLIKII